MSQPVNIAAKIVQEIRQEMFLGAPEALAVKTVRENRNGSNLVDKAWASR